MPSSRDSSHHNQYSAAYSSNDTSLHDKHNHVVKMLGGHDYSLWLQLVACISARGIEALQARLLSRLAARQVNSHDFQQ